MNYLKIPEEKFLTIPLMQTLSVYATGLIDWSKPYTFNLLSYDVERLQILPFEKLEPMKYSAFLLEKIFQTSC